MRLIDNIDEMIEPLPEKIVKRLPKVGEIDGLADALVVFDDMMNEVDDRVKTCLRADHITETFPWCSWFRIFSTRTNT